MNVIGGLLDPNLPMAYIAGSPLNRKDGMTLPDHSGTPIDPGKITS